MSAHDDEVACSICGAEHDTMTSPELDSTHLCPDCATMQRRAASTTSALRWPWLPLNSEREVDRAAE